MNDITFNQLPNLNHYKDSLFSINPHLIQHLPPILELALPLALAIAGVIILLVIWGQSQKHHMDTL